MYILISKSRKTGEYKPILLASYHFRGPYEIKENLDSFFYNQTAYCTLFETEDIAKYVLKNIINKSKENYTKRTTNYFFKKSFKNNNLMNIERYLKEHYIFIANVNSNNCPFDFYATERIIELERGIKNKNTNFKRAKVSFKDNFNLKFKLKTLIKTGSAHQVN